MIDLDWRGRPRRWSRLREVLLNPRVDARRLEAAVAAARARAPRPLIWLVGKTQAGKTAIIRALTGSERAEIGNGFQPCTKHSRIYDFPLQAPLVRFLDTRGLGEVAYDPEEDIRFGESQAHLLLGVIKAGDMEQDSVFQVIRAVRGRHPEWPLVIAQTGLHELYPPGVGHPRSYPFDDEDWPAAVPHDLARALKAQRARAGEIPGRTPPLWVPVDFTLAEDGYDPEHYGSQVLWRAIEDVGRLRLRALLGSDAEVSDLFARTAHPQILGYALAAAGVGALPLVDLAGVPALQAKMLQSLAGIYEQDWDRQAILEFLGLLGTGIGVAYGARVAGRTLVKLVPYLGQTLGAVWGASASGATTFALGKAAAYHFQRRNLGLATDAAALRRLFAEQLSRGSEILRDSLGSGRA